jgi:hypothetical protein
MAFLLLDCYEYRLREACLTLHPCGARIMGTREERITTIVILNIVG